MFLFGNALAKPFASLGHNLRVPKEPATPYNFSDTALIHGSEACAVLASIAAWLGDESALQIFVAACDGLLMGAALLLVGLVAIRQPPGIVARITKGERID